MCAANTLVLLKVQNGSGGVARDESRRFGGHVAKGLDCHAQDFERYSVAHRCLSRKHNQICILEKSLRVTECGQKRELRSKGAG